MLGHPGMTHWTVLKSISLNPVSWAPFSPSSQYSMSSVCLLRLATHAAAAQASSCHTHSYNELFLDRNLAIASVSASDLDQPVAESGWRRQQMFRKSSSAMIQRASALGKHEQLGSVGTD